MIDINYELYKVFYHVAFVYEKGSFNTMKQFITEYLDNKIKQNEDMIIITFYELRIKYDLSEDETQEFLSLSKIRLENMKYQVYFTGAKYEQNGVIKTVQDNELMVAIKEKF